MDEERPPDRARGAGAPAHLPIVTSEPGHMILQPRQSGRRPHRDLFRMESVLERKLHPQGLDAPGALGEVSLHGAAHVAGELVVCVGAQQARQPLVLALGIGPIGRAVHARLFRKWSSEPERDATRSDRPSFMTIRAASSFRPRWIRLITVPMGTPVVSAMSR